jgi:hypothetical protein
MAGYIGKTPLTQAQQFRVEHTATAGQTDFLVNYAPGFIDVFMNGVKLGSTDFTATDGLKIVLGAAALVGDEMNIVAYRNFDLVSGTYFPFYKSSGSFDSINLTVDNKLPFFNAAGTAKNVALTI